MNSIKLDRGVLLAKKFAAAKRLQSTCSGCGKPVGTTDRAYFRWSADGKTLASINCGTCADSAEVARAS